MAGSKDSAAPAVAVPAGETMPASYYRRRTRQRLLLLGAMALTLVVMMVATITNGSVPLTLTQIWNGVFHPGDVASQTRVVLWELRLPIATMAALVGACLGLAGAYMQTILGNPLAEPFTLGISGGAAFGAAVVIVTGWVLPFAPTMSVTLGAWAASLATGLVIALAAQLPGSGTERLILLGIALVFGYNALLALLQYMASTEALAQIVFWTMGSLTRATWGANATIAIALLIVAPIGLRNAWKLTALRLGDDRARGMGIRVSRVRAVTLVGVCLLASTAVAFAGVIGFIGLLGPHVARRLVGEDQRFFAPASMLCGATLLTAAHLVSLLIIPGVALPVGIVTAIVGVPVFLLLVLGHRRNVWS